MARPARFTPDGILDAAAQVVADRWREATVADVAHALQTPPNSVYYRFETKDVLFGSLWLRSVRRFHIGLLEALSDSDPQQAAIAAAVHIPVFCRDHRLEAIAMTLYRQQDLVRRVEGQLADAVQHVNDRVAEAMVELCSRRYGRTDEDTLALLTVACQESGYGLVRRYLRRDAAMPEWLEEAVAGACAGILDIGDRQA